MKLYGRRGKVVEVVCVCEIVVPMFHTVYAHVYHYAISELCKGLYHHNGV